MSKQSEQKQIDDSETALTGWVPGEIDRLVSRHRETGWVGLKPDQRAFAFSYIQSLSHVEAARAIGRGGQGLNYLRDPLVAAMIHDLQAEMHHRNMIVEDYVRQKWIEIMPKLMGEEEIPRMLADGTQAEGKHFDSGAVTRALTEIGKGTKFYEAGSGGKDKGQVVVNLNFGAVCSPILDQSVVVDGEIIEE